MAMITLFGQTGSGKSVQGELLARKYHWSWFALRDILMNTRDKDVQFALDHGMYVDDKMVTSLMRSVLLRAHSSSKNVVLDGFPSDYRQVRWMIDNDEIKYLKGAIILRVPHGELWKRLIERKRVDDTRAAIERREEAYDRAITGMIRALSQENVLIREVDGTGTPQDVLERIEEVLGEWGMVPRKQFEKISARDQRIITMSDMQDDEPQATTFGEALKTVIEVLAEGGN